MNSWKQSDVCFRLASVGVELKLPTGPPRDMGWGGGTRFLGAGAGQAM